jgi:hypothetical protein
MNIVVYTGYTRLLRENWESILNTTYYSDLVLFVLWSDNNQHDIQWLRNKLPLARIELIDQVSFHDAFDSSWNSGSFNRWLSQYYIIKVAYDILSEYHSIDYSIIIRSRTDLLVNSKVNFSILNYDVIVPGIKFGIGVTDYFAVMNWRGFQCYSNNFELLNYFKESNILVPPELSLGICLHDNSINVFVDRKLPMILLSSSAGKITIRNTYRSELLGRYPQFSHSKFVDNLSVPFFREFWVRLISIVFDFTLYLKFMFMKRKFYSE